MIHVPWTQKPPVGTPLDMSHPLCQGLVGCWPMNEGAGRVLDCATNRNISSVSNISQRNTVKGNCLSLASTYSGINMSDILLPFGTSARTFRFICYPLNLSKTYNILFGYGTDYYGNNLYMGFYANKLFMESSYRATNVTNNQVCYNNTWYDIVFTSKNANDLNAFDYYINGRKTINSASGSLSTVSNGSCNIGVTTNINCFYGYIALAQIYNRALSAREIASLYENPYQIFQPITLYTPFMIAAYNYWCKVGGTWEQALDMFVKINGGWEKATDIPKVKVGGVWV